MKKIISFAIFSLMILIPLLVFPAKTMFLSIKGLYEFGRGTAKGVSLDKQGRIGLSPELKEIFNNNDLMVYSFAKKDNQFFIGTGNNSTLYLYDTQTKNHEVLFKGEGLAINTIALDNNILYFTESPSNSIYKMDIKTKKIEKISVLDSVTYIWRLAVYQNKLYLATGDSAKIYEIDQQGNKKELFSQTGENHFLAMTLYKNFLYFGGEGRGILYKMDLLTGKTESLYDCYEDEISDIYVNAIGEIFFVTSSQTPKEPGTHFDYTDSFLIQERIKKPTQEEKKDGKNLVVKNSLYSYKNGTIYKYFTRDNTVLYSVVQGEDKAIYVGANGGAIYRYEEQGNKFSLFASLKEEQILILQKDKDTLLAATGNLGKIFSLGYAYGKEGEFITRVIDIGGDSRIGSFSWKAITPDKTKIEVYMRGGNSEKPDESWTDWLGPYQNPNGNVSGLKSVRFIQYKIRLLTENYYQTPLFDFLHQPFLLKNRKPSISFFKAELSPDKKKNTIIISWNAYDSDDDKLTYEILFKEKNDTVWLPLTGKLYNNNYEADIRLFPDGEYQFKLLVSDELNNIPLEKEIAEETSQTVIIDSTSPVIKNIVSQKIGDYIRIEGILEDNMSSLAGAYYSVNAQEWFYFLPKDGMFDSTKEAFALSIPIEQLAKNEKENIIFIRFFDARDNQTTVKIKINDKGKLLDGEK